MNSRRCAHVCKQGIRLRDRDVSIKVHTVTRVRGGEFVVRHHESGKDAEASTACSGVAHITERLLAYRSVIQVALRLLFARRRIGVQFVQRHPYSRIRLCCKVVRYTRYGCFVRSLALVVRSHVPSRLMDHGGSLRRPRRALLVKRGRGPLKVNRALPCVSPRSQERERRVRLLPDVADDVTQKRVTAEPDVSRIDAVGNCPWQLPVTYWP